MFLSSSLILSLLFFFLDFFLLLIVASCFLLILSLLFFYLKHFLWLMLKGKDLRSRQAHFLQITQLIEKMRFRSSRICLTKEKQVRKVLVLLSRNVVFCLLLTESKGCGVLLRWNPNRSEVDALLRELQPTQTKQF